MYLMLTLTKQLEGDGAATQANAMGYSSLTIRVTAPGGRESLSTCVWSTGQHHVTKHAKWRVQRPPVARSETMALA